MQERRQLKLKGYEDAHEAIGGQWSSSRFTYQKKKQLNVSFNGNGGALIDKTIKRRRCCRA